MRLKPGIAYYQVSGSSPQGVNTDSILQLNRNWRLTLNIFIRQEQEKDIDAVYQVVKTAFETMELASGDEQDLVNRLRESNAFIPELSLVAEQDGKIIGHILFTRMKIGEHVSLALAPVAVLPDCQGQGVGNKLILEGHRIAKELGYRSVIVVGHPRYYPRFGYRPASRWMIAAPFKVPDEAFMAFELADAGLEGVSGEIEYAKEFFEST
jgi:predicted N-acetyltransferase YhbS